MQHSNFYCKPAHGERIETKLSVTPDVSAAIHGVVSDPDGAPLPDVLVLLFRVEDPAKRLVLTAQIHTDPDGHFAFGGLSGDTLYRIKLFAQNKRIRELTLSPTD